MKLPFMLVVGRSAAETGQLLVFIMRVAWLLFACYVYVGAVDMIRWLAQ